jgi:enamine deaminase RidA (YjgF/YER057c/UK114 family)
MSDLIRIDPGPRMSEAVIYNGVLYASGMVADTTVGRPVYEQTQDILAQIDDLLARAGSNKSRILKANIWLSDMGQFAEMNRAWDAWVVPGQTPARATVESRLAGQGYDVEIMIEAAV